MIKKYKLKNEKKLLYIHNIYSKMTNRWVIFVKGYAKVNNISYNGSMCEIKIKACIHL